MRILCYINTLGRGGAERVLANQAICFAKVYIDQDKKWKE